MGMTQGQGNHSMDRVLLELCLAIQQSFRFLLGVALINEKWELQDTGIFLKYTQKFS